MREKQLTILRHGEEWAKNMDALECDGCLEVCGEDYFGNSHRCTPFAGIEGKINTR